MRKLTYVLAFFAFTYSYAQSSVLSAGNWFKIGVIETGMYKLSRADLQNLGLNVGTLDPRKISIYGNGVNGILPQANAEARPIDLLENSISISGESDGSFDENDFILFYAKGPDKIQWSPEGFEFEKNIYSDTAYYFVKVGEANGKRVESKASLPGSGTIISTFDDHLFFEEDVNNILNSGREWYGELLSDGETVNHTYEVPGVASELSMAFRGVSQVATLNTFEIGVDGNSAGVVDLSSIPSGDGTTYSIKAREGVGIFVLPQTEKLNLRITFDGNIPSARGFIDRYEITFKRDLALYGSHTIFRKTENLGELLNYQISNAANSQVWNVSDPTNAASQQIELSGAIASFQSQATELEEFVIFLTGDLPSPALLGSFANQNLRGDTNYEAVIVSSEEFLIAAEQLAQFHRNHDGLTIKIVTPGQIYNEFSSGRQDVSAIRDYVKHVYERGGQLKYLLLFGDCSFDYKERENNNTNFVPTYESRDSFHPIFSHSSDDYFGFFEDSEGEWIESSAGDHTMEIGIGRLPAKSMEEAKTMVDKIIYYSTSPNTLGKWRNQISYLADDGDGNTHASHAEQLSELVDTTYSQYRIEKILLDSFDQVVTANNDEISPETTRALKARIKEGTFSINFIGHGNERLWMSEQVLTNNVIEKLTNLDKMPVFITATCEFGRYDDPSVESGAEKLLLSENGGAIALLTTSRPVFASTNFELNEAFHRNVFRKVDGQSQRLGDIIRITKNEGLQGPVNRNFTLLGDPMLMPAFPELDVIINELETQVDTLSALEEITFTGQVERNGQVETNFNGIVDIVILDEKQNFKTKGQESSPYNYTVRSNALFRGEATVTDGSFSFTFLVPKTITYQFNIGKMSLYAWDEQQNIDASGSSRAFVMGGTNLSSEENLVPPTIEMFLNDRSFQNGSTVSASSILFAEISDENGITTTGNGLVQGITLVLNDESINLNQFYSANLDTYKSGRIVYPIQDLAPGSYTATLQAYDTHNNLATQEIRFVVSEESFISLFNTMTFPNPSFEETTFSFEHDREEEDLEVSLFVYNSHADVVYSGVFEYENSKRLVELEWLNTTNSGQPLNPGVYFYRVIIKSRSDGAVKEIANKLVITN
ncbi:MAG: type IX secretion system sortase PorU [Cyclobacteriaceae bacterium]